MSCKRPVLLFESRRLVQILVSCQSDQFPRDVYIPCSATGVYSDGFQKSVTETASWEETGSLLNINSGGNTGWVYGVGLGATVLRARIGQIQGTLPITVTPATVVGCAVVPANFAFRVGNNVQYSSICIFSDSSYVDVTNSASWTSSAPATATVAIDFDHRGLVTAADQGTSTIAATFQAVVGSTLITVLPKDLMLIQVGPPVATVVQGLGLPFTTTGIYTDLTTADLTPLTTWSTTDSSIASISNTTGTIGYLTALQIGSTTVVANFGQFSDTATVTVTNPVLNTITVTPANPSVAKGLSQAMVATGNYSDGSSVDITSFVTWGSADVMIASPSNVPGSNGITAAVGAGSTNITATLGVVVGLTTFTVTVAELASIAVAPSNPTLSVSQTLQMTAIGTYTDSSIADLTSTVTWISSNGASVSVSNAMGTEGLATAVSSGTATLFAVIGAITGQTDVSVTPAILVSITVTPVNPSISGLGSRQLTATGNYSDASTMDLTTSVTWTPGNPAIITVSNSPGNQGLATGVSVGSTTATATFGLVSGQTTVNVIPPVLMSIAVTPTNSTIRLLTNKQFTAMGSYADGSTINLTTNVTWASTNIAAATISNAPGTQGLATGLLLGSTTISATLGVISGSTLLTCTLF